MCFKALNLFMEKITISAIFTFSPSKKKYVTLRITPTNYSLWKYFYEDGLCSIYIAGIIYHFNFFVIVGEKPHSCIFL